MTPTLLLTRPRTASEQFAVGLTGADVVISPLMEIVATGASLPMDGVEGLIFTSHTAIPFTPRSALPAYCVGPRTAQAARDAGFDVRITEANADALVDAMKANPPVGSLLHIHGVHVRGNVAFRLNAAGMPTQDIAAYDQKACPPDAAFHAALTRTSVIVPLFSPRSAQLFAEAAKVAPTHILALSQAVADALPADWRTKTHVLPAPQAREMDIAMEPFGVKRNWP